MYALEGANIGFQLGGQATDFVLLIMNTRGAESLMKSKVKLGADAAAAAGDQCGASLEGVLDGGHPLTVRGLGDRAHSPHTLRTPSPGSTLAIGRRFA